MKKITKESSLFSTNKIKATDYNNIIAKLEESQKVEQELNNILSALNLQEMFPQQTKTSNIVSDLKKGDYIIKRGSKTMGEVIDVNDDSLMIKVGNKQIKVWRQEVKRVC